MKLERDEFIRYSRQLMLPDVGESGQLKLKTSRVAIVGLGGLGSAASLYLAGAGVGTLILCDPDQVEKSNLQRQIIYRNTDSGRSKALQSAAHLTELNPNIQTVPIQHSVQQNAVPTELANVDLIIDATDNSAARLALNNHCHSQRIPLISASAIGWEGQIVEFEFQSDNSPCLACFIDPSESDPVDSCATAGILGPVLGVMGSMQAALAIQHLIGLEKRRHGRLWRLDVRNMNWLELELNPNPHCPICT